MDASRTRQVAMDMPWNELTLAALLLLVLHLSGRV
jgi:hypothetical protein